MRNCGIFAMRLCSANHNASAFHGPARNTSSIPRHLAGFSLSRPIGPISPVSLASAKVLHFRPLTFRFLPFPLKFAEYFRFLLHFSLPPVSPTSQTASISPNPQPLPCPTMTSFYPWATNPKTSRPSISMRN